MDEVAGVDGVVAEAERAAAYAERRRIVALLRQQAEQADSPLVKMILQMAALRIEEE